MSINIGIGIGIGGGGAQAADEGWHTATAVCHTEGCANNGEPRQAAVPDDPEFYNWQGVVCGVCEQKITDVTTA